MLRASTRGPTSPSHVATPSCSLARPPRCDRQSGCKSARTPHSLALDTQQQRTRSRTVVARARCVPTAASTTTWCVLAQPQIEALPANQHARRTQHQRISLDHADIEEMDEPTARLEHASSNKHAVALRHGDWRHTKQRGGHMELASLVSSSIRPGGEDDRGADPERGGPVGPLLGEDGPREVRSPP